MKNLRPPLPETSIPWDVLLEIIFTEIRPVKAVSHQRSIYLQILISIVLLTLTYIFRDRQKYPRQEKKPETELSPKLQLLFQRPAVQGFLQAASSLPRAEWNRITGRNIESTGNTASRIRTGSSILAADNIESSKKTRESLFEEGREQLNRVPASTTARVSGSEDVLPENKKMSGEKPDSGLTVKKIFSALLTLAGAAACVLIVHYFHMRSVGITPEIGVFSALAGQALESDRAEQEESADESGAQDAPAGDDQPSDSADPSASDVQDETDAAGSDQDVSAGSPDQPVPDGEEATGFDPASDPASLYPASRDPVSPVPSTPDQAYSDPAYSDPAYTDPASQDPASYDPASLDPAYANQEADQEIDPDDESDWDSFEEEPEDETEG